MLPPPASTVARVEPAPGRAWSPRTACGSTSWPGSTSTRALGSPVERRAGEGGPHPRARAGVRRCSTTMRWRRLLRQRAAGAPVIEGRAVGANHDRWQSTVVLHDARLVDALVVVDATGPWPAVVHRADVIDGAKPTATAAARTAYGLVARCWRAARAARPLRADGLVTGRRSRPRWAGRRTLVLLGLRSWPTVGGSCRRRAWRRGRRWGRSGWRRGCTSDWPAWAWWCTRCARWRKPRCRSGSRCRVAASGRSAFGAAAAMVDPLTGWSGRVRSCGPLPSWPRRSWPRSNGGPRQRGCRPRPGAPCGPLSGAEPERSTSTRCGRCFASTADSSQAFFDALFELPDEQWFGYLTGQASPRRVAATMREAFGGVSSGLRAKLALASPWLLAGGLR